MRSRHDGVVLWIGAFKLVKASLLVTLGLAGLFGLKHDVVRTVRHALAWTGGFPGRQTVLSGLSRLGSLGDRQAEHWGMLSLAYAAVFLVEGAGLLARRRWAEWLTVVVTGSFIPIEVYELVEHSSAGKVIALILNVVIVAYLVMRRLRERQGIARRLATAVSAP